MTALFLFCSGLGPVAAQGGNGAVSGQRHLGPFAASTVKPAPAPKASPSGAVFARAPHLANGPTAAELTFDLSGPATVKSFVLAKPDRIVIDLPRVEFASAPAEAVQAHHRPGHGTDLVASYRFGLFAPDKSRIVIGLSGPARVVRAVTIPAAGASRLVISLARTDRAGFLAAAKRDLQIAEAAARAAAPAPAAKTTNAHGLPIVVIDPGHGGIDSGAVVHGLVEKKIVFAFATELADKLRASGRYKIIMTRTSDVFVSLGDRVKIARDAGAALFVSIHADTIPNAPDVSGTTVYTCSKRASDAEAARTAATENQADAVAGVESKDESGGVSNILFDLTREETQTYSHVFARTLVNYWQVASRLNKNPERSAGFRVLKAPDVPSVLIELGYLSNAGDGRELTSPVWRDKTTDRVAAAINAFFAAKEGHPAKAAAAPTAEALDTMPTAATK